MKERKAVTKQPKALCQTISRAAHGAAVTIYCLSGHASPGSYLQTLQQATSCKEAVEQFIVLLTVFFPHRPL